LEKEWPIPWEPGRVDSCDYLIALRRVAALGARTRRPGDSHGRLWDVGWHRHTVGSLSKTGRQIL